MIDYEKECFTCSVSVGCSGKKGSFYVSPTDLGRSLLTDNSSVRQKANTKYAAADDAFEFLITSENLPFTYNYSDPDYDYWIELLGIGTNYENEASSSTLLYAYEEEQRKENDEKGLVTGVEYAFNTSLPKFGSLLREWDYGVPYEYIFTKHEIWIETTVLSLSGDGVYRPASNYDAKYTHLFITFEDKTAPFSQYIAEHKDDRYLLDYDIGWENGFHYMNPILIDWLLDSDDENVSNDSRPVSSRLSAHLMAALWEVEWKYESNPLDYCNYVYTSQELKDVRTEEVYVNSTPISDVEKVAVGDKVTGIAYYMDRSRNISEPLRFCTEIVNHLE